MFLTRILISYFFFFSFFTDNALKPSKASKRKMKKNAATMSKLKTQLIPPIPLLSPVQPTSIVARGMPPPPPPPPLPMSNIRPMQWLPEYLKPKKKFHANVPMKKANWVDIEPRKISKKAFWAQCQEHKLASEDVLIGLAAKFCKKVIVKKNIPRYTTKKAVDLRVINHKSAHNISILLAATLKRVSYEQIKECILRCDTSETSVLNSNIIQQLIKYLPPQNQLKRLQEIKENGIELSEPEKFVATIGEINHLVLRLHSIDLKLRFDDIARDIGSNIDVGVAAFEELEKSKKFGQILELILLFGNFMNFGSSKGPAFGFEISFLAELNGMKDSNNKQTLLQYIVEVIERKFPELLSFGVELPHAENAVKVSFEIINDNMKVITTSLENLNMALKEIKEPHSSDDQFHEIFGEIANRYDDELQSLIKRSEMMEKHYKRLGEYFSFDPEKYPMERLFRDITTFKAMFKQAHIEVQNAKS